VAELARLCTGTREGMDDVTFTEAWLLSEDLLTKTVLQSPALFREIYWMVK